MEESLDSKLPKLKVELNLATLVGSVLVVAFAFILPVALIQNYKSDQGKPSQETEVSGPKVAGASTTREAQEITLPIINQNVKLEGQSGVLILLGIILIGFCFFIVLFLLIDSLKKKQKLN